MDQMAGQMIALSEFEIRAVVAAVGILRQMWVDAVEKVGAESRRPLRGILGFALSLHP
jgi:hypothetical protein